jgi:hypothetical protein
MRKRIHSSLGYLTPDEYEKKWNEQKKEKHDIREGGTSLYSSIFCPNSGVHFKSSS